MRSEHERHSPSCRFVRNVTNPNVPASLTLSALAPFEHHMNNSNGSSIIFSSTRNTDWIATAFNISCDINMWRTDRVVQANFSL